MYSWQRTRPKPSTWETCRSSSAPISKVNEGGRLDWCGWLGLSKRETSDEYRRLKNVLRTYIGDPNYRLAQLGGAGLKQILAARRSAIEPLAARLAELGKSGELTQSRAAIYRSFVHLHLNRLMAADAATESRALGLLLRTRESLAHSPLTPRFPI
jgi:lantibiotic biosynthesis protein